MQTEFTKEQQQKAQQIIVNALGDTDSVRALREQDINVILQIASMWGVTDNLFHRAIHS
jgi:hypothetical protein